MSSSSTSNVERLIEESRRLEQENKVLHSRLEVAERDKAMADLQRRTLQDEKAVLKEQIDTAVATERKRADEIRGEWTAVVQQHSNDLRRLRQENENLRRQNEMLTEEVSKKASGQEVNNVRLSAQLTQLQKELAAKDAELTNAVKEAQFMRDNLERVVKELVERNKRTDEESKRRAAQHEKDMNDLLAEHQRRVAEIGELRKEQQQSKEDRVLLEAQVSHGKQLNKDLTDDLEALRSKLSAAESAFEEVQHEARELRRQEDDMRSDIDELLGKLTKADSHIQRLTEEASQANLTALKLRHQLEITEDDVATLRRDKEEIVRRLGPLLHAAGDQVDALARAMDSVVGGAAELATGAPTPSSRSINFKCWPDAGDAAQATAAGGDAQQGLNAPSHESQLLMCALRLRDVTALIGEDLSLIQRAVADAHVRLREAARREQVLEDGFKAERAHVLELAAKVGEVEAELQRSDDSRKNLERTLVESSQWMSEAVSMGDERTRRVEMLVAERNALEVKLSEVQTQLREANSESHKMQREVDNARAEVARAAAEAQQHARARSAVEADLNNAKLMIQTLRQQVAETEAAEQRAKLEAAAKRTAEERAEQDARVSRKLADEAAARASHKDRDLEEAEKREQKLRDQLYESQKRLDAALRRPTATASSGSTGASSSSGHYDITPASIPVAAVTTPKSGASVGSYAARSSPLKASTTYVVSSPRRATTVGAPTTATAEPPLLRSAAAASASIVASSSPAPVAPASASAPPHMISPTRTNRGGGAFALPAAESASTDRLRQWEAKINSMLAQVRSPPL